MSCRKKILRDDLPIIYIHKNDRNLDHKTKGQKTMCVNRLMLGDNLEILKTVESESVDLVYLDPPFFSNRNYEVIWGDSGEIRSFQDRWSGGIDHYIAWLKERVEQMHRVLKKTGSIFLHCDWHADAYIRVQILDRIFGVRNFRNHIIWKRTNTPKGSQFENRVFGVAADSIFWYSKTAKYVFDDKTIRTSLQEEQVSDKYPKEDDKGRYYEYPIIRSASKGARPNLVYEYKGFTPTSWGWVVNKEKLKEIDKRGDLGWRSNGQPYRKFRPEEDPGQLINNIWDDILRIQSNSKEAIGYPTQKPEALLERIIKAVTNEGDTVLDPFVGGGTTVAIADKLRRKWIGIDQSPVAVKVTDMRLQKQADMFSSSYSLHLHKYDYDTLRHKEAFEFESWIIEQFGGVPQNRKGGDLGVDGKTADGVPIQVKRTDGVPRDVIDKFQTAIRRYDKNLFLKNQKAKEPVGHIIAFSFNKGAVSEAARLKNDEGIIIKLIKVEDIVPMSFKPSLAVTINELDQDASGDWRIEFIAKGESEAGIEFYSWDFAYEEKKGFKPSVVFDKAGKQILSLKIGARKIAVKAVDNNGLESMEIVELKINGGVSRG